MLRPLVRCLRSQRFHWTWWLAVLALLALCGQVFEHSLGMKGVRAAELEGFGDEWDEEDEPAQAVVPPTSHIRPNFQASRGSIEGSREDDEDDDDGGSDMVLKSAGVKPRQDEWDEDEFEGVEALEKAEPVQKAPGRGKAAVKKQRISSAPSGPKHFYFEAAAVVLLMFYLTNYFIGGRRNEQYPRAFAKEFAEPGRIFHKNFSLLGVGTDSAGDRAMMLKEGQATFKFYASGRRFCQGMLATLHLQARQDLFMTLLSVVQPATDLVRFEVSMNNDDMEPFIFALGRKRAAKSMLKNERDLKDYASIVDSPRPKKLADDLTIISESRDLVADLLPESVLDLVLGEKAFAAHGKYFVSMHFTDNAPPPKKKALSFVFNLPPIDKMEDLTRLVSLIPFYIDLVGKLRLTAQQRAKAEERRSKTVNEDLKEKMRIQAELLAKRKADKKAAEEEALQGLSREQQRREEEKRRKKEIAKMMPKAKISRR